MPPCAAAEDTEPLPANEIESLLWMPRERLSEVLGAAPYHAAFLRWLADGERYQFDVWEDGGSR